MGVVVAWSWYGMDRKMDELRAWSEGVWIAEAPLRFYGVPFGCRMTVIRLGDGSLLLHSPIAIPPHLQRRIDALGPVRHIVSPNKLHHLHLDSALRTYPQARLHVPPGLVQKRPEWRSADALTDVPPEAWADILDQRIIRGSKRMQEVVFLHRASRTLIVADLCEYFGSHSPWLTRVVARVSRMYERPRMPPDWQWTFHDREACRDSFQRLFAWDFDRVVLAHGALIESDAKRILRQEYAWALT